VPDTSGQPGGDLGAVGMDYIAAPLRVLAVPLDSVVLDPANVRRHPERNLEAIRGSLARFGQRAPIVVQRQGMVVRAGNGRVEAARTLGWTHIAAVVVDEGDVEATAFALADNRSAELAAWDEAALHELVAGMDADLRAVAGWNDEELRALASAASAGDTKGDASPQLGGSVFQVVVECPDEETQADLIGRLEEEGYKCRALML